MMNDELSISPKRKLGNEDLNDALNYKLMVYIKDFFNALLPEFHSNRKTKCCTLF